MDTMFLIFVVLLLCSVCNKVICERQDINSLLYEKFDNAASCFRVLNATHQFGCSSSLSGNLGVIHLVQTEQDVDWLVNKAKAGPYMAIVPPNVFNKRDIMVKLQKSNDVSGILLAINGSMDRPDAFSPDDTCPNRYSGAGTCSDTDSWNPEGTSFLLMDWGKPMFMVKDPVVITKIHECFNKFNHPLDDSQLQKSLCSLQMKSHMLAAVNTPTCIRRSQSYNFFNPLLYCDSMGDKNIVGSLKPINKPKNGSIILISTRIDAASMFDGVMLGAMTTMTGLVTFLAVAKLLASAIPETSDHKKNVMFAMFNGEMYDYIGSGRTVYDIKNKKFPTVSRPIDLEHIGLMVDVSQMSKSTTLYCHYSNSTINDVNSVTKDFCNGLRNSTESNLNVTDEIDSVLPSSSVHSFIKEDKSIPAVVLANHGKHYINRYYNGLMDNVTNIDYTYYNGSVPDNTVQAVLADIAKSLFKTLYKIVTEKQYVGPDPNMRNIIDELLHCYLETGQCSIFTEATAGDKPPPDPAPLYVGVYRSPNTITQLTAFTLAYFTGRKTNLTEAECRHHNENYNFFWMRGASGKGECKKASVRVLKALSPAFEIEGYNWSSGKYSTWSESVWQEMSLRMFLKPSRQQELTTFILGLVTLVVSFIVVYWIKSQSHLLFHTEVGVAC